MLSVDYDEAFNFLSTATYSRSQLSENENVKYIHYGDTYTKFKHYLDLSKRYSFIENGDIEMADASEDYKGVGKSVEVINGENIRAISGFILSYFRDKANNL